MSDKMELALHVGVTIGTAYMLNICDPKAAIIYSVSTIAGGVLSKKCFNDNFTAMLGGQLIGLLATNVSGYDLRAGQTWLKLTGASETIMEIGRIIVNAANNGLDPVRIDPMV